MKSGTVTPVPPPEEEKTLHKSTNPLARKSERERQFVFNGAFGPGASQREIFEQIQDMVEEALMGQHVTIIAYGQTGSGKTYTMEGGLELEQQGVIPRAFSLVLHK